MEGAGTVEAVGPGVYTVAAGIANFCLWLLADLLPDLDLCPLYPRKQTFGG